MTSTRPRRRGRPLDPGVGQAVLTATLQLLTEHGYEGVRVADVAEQAGAGLGALYRRWPTKRALVLAALRSLAVDESPAPTGDPRSDVLAALDEIATVISSPAANMMLNMLVSADRELADALREAKLEPQLARLRQRLRAAVGDVTDLDTRAQLGPALISFRTLVLGHKVTHREVRDEILPQVLRDPQSAPLADAPIPSPTPDGA